MTATRVAVAKADDIKPGQLRIVQANDARIALCNVGGSFFAIEDVCTHDDGPLGEGTLRGNEVECPRHGGRFDVRTGQATRMPAVVPVRKFAVTVDGGQIFVEVPDEF